MVHSMTARRQRLVVAIVLTVAAIACSESTWQGGIHAELAWSASRGLRVVDVPTKGPATEAGLKTGDRIISIDGLAVQDQPMKRIVEALRGPVGSRATMEIIRGGRALTLHIERAPYRSP
jgi:C-terminal processing protease CtpA/Prc